jgi:hypothetical protein
MKAALDEIMTAIALLQDLVATCEVAFNGIAEMDDSDQQSLLAIKMKAYIKDRSTEIKACSRKAIKVMDESTHNPKPS